MFARACAYALLSLFSSLVAKDLIVGTASGYAPFVSINERGDYEGFDIDFAKALANKLDTKCVIKDLGSLPSLFLALKKRKIDCIIWAVSITEERKRQMEMVHYQGEDTLTLPLLFWGKVPDGIASLEGLLKSAKSIVCVEAGSYQDHYMQKYDPKQVRQVNTVTEALLDIRFKKSDAILVDPAILAKLMKNNPELKVMDVPLSIEEQAFGNGICVDKDNLELKNQIENAVMALKKEGTIRSLEEKWLK